MRFRFVVEVECEREEGKFESRDDIGDQIRDAIEGADPGSITGYNGGTYGVMDWSVNEEAVPAVPRVKKR